MAMSFEDLQAQVELLTAALQSQGMGGTLGQRSPVLGPHTNLLSPPPSAKVAKQNFFYDGMDLPSTRTDFPVLRFRLTETGVQEKCCKNQKEVDALGEEWVTTPPTMDLPSPLEALEEQFDPDATGGATVAVRVNKPVPETKPRTRGPNKPKKE